MERRGREGARPASTVSTQGDVRSQERREKASGQVNEGRESGRRTASCLNTVAGSKRHGAELQLVAGKEPNRAGRWTGRKEVLTNCSRKPRQGRGARPSSPASS
uniref:Uncharacterized protein n=1 Tax=Zea mays TaxID=4577 RepID=B8A2W1_MAIZE|nr:unknown [Zea mays]